MGDPEIRREDGKTLLWYRRRFPEKKSIENGLRKSERMEVCWGKAQFASQGRLTPKETDGKVKKRREKGKQF